MRFLPYPDLFSSPDALRRAIEEANRVYASGTFADVLAFRWHELPSVLVLDCWVFPRTLGLFAFGAWIWRKGVLQRPAEHSAAIATAAAVGMVLGGAASLSAVGLLGGSSEGPWQSVLDGFGAILLAVGYAAAVVLLLDRHDIPFLRKALVPLGRMALTNYLTQSVIFGLVFYGYGCGQFGKMGVARAGLLGTAVFGAQLTVSAWWLRHFRFGPVEWVWRWATYQARPPLRR